MVILVIGILIAGVFEGGKMLRSFKLTSARALTQSSPVQGIKNLVAWYESTSERSFDSTIDASNSSSNTITNWYDINQQQVAKNGTQSTSSQRPLLVENIINGLPVVKFDMATDQYLNLPNGTVPYANSPYTVFIVFKMSEVSNIRLLKGGEWSPANALNQFNIGSGRQLANYWNGTTATTDTWLLRENTSYIADFWYDQSNIKIYKDGTLVQTQASSLNVVVATSNKIGPGTGSPVLAKLYLAETIIFDRALTDEERKAIEDYLSKKWGIAVS